MLHSDIDLHKNDLVIDTLDASGNAVAHRRLRAERPLVARCFRSLSGPAASCRRCVSGTARPEPSSAMRAEGRARMVRGRPSVGDSCVDTATGTAARTKDETIAAVAAEHARCRAPRAGSAPGVLVPLTTSWLLVLVGPDPYNSLGSSC
jgi:hypothetical protein